MYSYIKRAYAVSELQIRETHKLMSVLEKAVACLKLQIISPVA